MHTLNYIDIAVILFYFLVVFFIALYYSKKAGKNTGEFFLSGRNLPWYISGTAMVATTFAADTPLAVTELVAKNGISGNWLWWNMAIGSMLTVFFFARLWRRAQIMTDVEFIELRYDGKAAAALRGFKALYLGLFMNIIILGWVHKAMEKIFAVIFPQYDSFGLVVIAAIIIGIYSAASGLLGTSRTDSFQFVFAMIGCIILAVIVVSLPEVGGMTKLKEKLSPQVISFIPRIGSSEVVSGIFSISIGSFFAYVALQWWASWYPGADPGGGGYIAQRMMSAKDEKHSLFATLWFTIAHYAIRPWPWILVALAALVILPRTDNLEQLKTQNPDMYDKVVEAYNSNTDLNTLQYANSPEFKEMYEVYENTVDPGMMYPKLMVRFLPAGLLGLLIAVFLAAYMSTIASQLNWGTSYIINDFYRRFIKNNADERHYVMISRVSILILTILSLLITKYFLSTISGAWEFILNASAGIGAVLILRWYWWRINAWSEISAMIAPLFIYPLVRYYLGIPSPISLFPIVLITTIIWLIVTYTTKPVNQKKLIEFYERTEPGGIGWRKITDLMGIKQSGSIFVRMFVNWLAGIVVIYSFLFGTGALIFQNYFKGFILLLISSCGAFIIYYNLKKIGFEKIIK
ncbi:sodium:solute symporter family protein [Melioribacter sp. OK-6-Me]|uniref:sodium:solute symporter family protein n=1 Tax=unclassified Melioribacter TaxID=2627329 RepID=UPI003EDB02CB